MLVYIYIYIVYTYFFRSANAFADVHTYLDYIYQYIYSDLCAKTCSYLVTSRHDPNSAPLSLVFLSSFLNWPGLQSRSLGLCAAGGGGNVAPDV